MDHDRARDWFYRSSEDIEQRYRYELERAESGGAEEIEAVETKFSAVRREATRQMTENKRTAEAGEWRKAEANVHRGHRRERRAPREIIYYEPATAAEALMFLEFATENVNGENLYEMDDVCNIIESAHCCLSTMA